MIRNDIIKPLVHDFILKLDAARLSAEELIALSNSIFMTNYMAVINSQNDMSLHEKKEFVANDLKQLYNFMIEALEHDTIPKERIK